MLFTTVVECIKCLFFIFKIVLIVQAELTIHITFFLNTIVLFTINACIMMFNLKIDNSCQLKSLNSLMVFKNHFFLPQEKRNLFHYFFIE